jgi:hypothetical protein
LSSQTLERPAAAEDQSTAAVSPQAPPSAPDVQAEAFDFITRHVLEKDSILFEG